MPDRTTIDREQRAGIYEVVCNHLAGLNDVWLALEVRGDFATARRLAAEFVEDVRLLEDIGWDREDGRESFELTMPRADLARLLRRLWEEAEVTIGEASIERRAREEDEEADRWFRAGARACESVLGTLGPKGRGDGVRPTGDER